ncbi:MAG: hypothetical protein LAT64_03770 [Phycisphaerales bacterium]|nr:hypothetical protein [Phycisphaerales bacterium]
MPDPSQNIPPAHLTAGADASTAEGGIWGRGRRRLERATLAGLGGSLVIHLLIVLLAAIVSIRFQTGDAGGAGDGGVEFAILDSSALAEDSRPYLQTARETVDTSPAESLVVSDLLAETAMERSVDDLSESIAPSLDPGGGGISALDAETGSAGAGSGEGGSFFGLEARGRRFAYIVDISGSMNVLVGGGRTRWEHTRDELLRSIRSLDPDAEFHVQLFSSGSYSLFGVDAWTKSTPMNRRLAADTLYGTHPSGGTLPMSAFETVFRLDPKADAIYFMSDGEVAGADAFLANVRRLNSGRRIPIHCILVGDLGGSDALRRAENMMRTLASQSGGRYVRIREGRP